MMQPEFTIVTASYNYANYIREMLDSVVAQEGVTVEHIIFDAGSTDGTLDVIREYDHVNLTVEPDNGMSAAINKGFIKAMGKWVMWLNTDDRLKPGALLKVKIFIENQPDADVIYGCCNFIDREGRHLKTRILHPFKKLMLAHYGCYIASTACFFKNETVMKHGHFLNECFRCVMDGEYYNRLAAEGKKFAYIREIIADFRLHDESISQKYLTNQKMNGILCQQLHYAESVAIRRVYGVTLFPIYLNWGQHLNNVVDTLLYIYFVGVRQVLKIVHSLYIPLSKSAKKSIERENNEN